MNDVALALVLFDCLNAMHNTDSLKDKADACMLSVLGSSVTPVGLQVVLSEFQDSRVKIVWMNTFSAKYGMEFLDFLKQSIRMVVSE